MKTETKTPARLYDKKNDVVRIESFQELDDHLAVAVSSFFRLLGVPHLYQERVAPVLKAGDAHVFAALRDRPWPPWGLGARKIAALCQVHPVGQNSFAMSPIFVGDDDVTNIGLMMALHKEVLDHLAREQKAEINYLVLEGSIFADRVLRANGFHKSDDLVLTEEGRYHFYRADATELSTRLGLEKQSTPGLLAHEMDDETFMRNALFHSMIDLATQYVRVGERVLREIAVIFGGRFDAALPGGLPPTPPTPGPEIPGGGEVEIPGVVVRPR